VTEGTHTRGFLLRILIVIVLVGLGIVIGQALTAANDDQNALDVVTTDVSPLVMHAAETQDSPQSINEMAARTDVVARGYVVAVNKGRALDDAPGEPIVQIVDVVMKVDETLSGKADSDLVTIEWMAWSEGGDQGDPRRVIVLDGLETPEIGQEMIWFVTREEGSVDGVPRFGLVSLDGILTVVDGFIDSRIESFTEDGGEPRLAVRSSGMTVEELAVEIGG
jgi:hypothetical protein